MTNKKEKKPFVLFKLAPFLKPYKWSLLAAVLAIVVSVAANAAAPMTEGLITTQLLKDVTDMAKGVPGAGVRFDYVLRIMGILLCFYALNAGGQFACNFLLTNAVQNAMRDLRDTVEQKIRKLPIRYFDSHAVGDVQSRISNDVDTISNALQQSFTQVIVAVLMLVFAIVMLYSIHWVMATAAILIIPLSALVSQFVIRKSQKHFVRQQNALGRLNGKVQEMYTGFSEIKLYGKQEDAKKDFGAVNQELCESGFKAQFVSGLMSPLVSLVTYLGIAVTAVMGALYAVAGAITVGNLQAFVRYIWQINQPLSQVTQLSATIQAAFAAMGRVFEFLEAEEEVPEAKEPVKLSAVRGDVSFEHVFFSYSPEKPLIKDFDAQVKSGQMVAIVGPTGVGKTTLINLLMRFYDVTGGAIKIDGVDIRDMRRQDLRAMFAMVLQDTWLFRGTIAENIAYGNQGATREDIVRAAKTANVHHFIKTLAGGYDMVINEEASNISQGEKQLLTIARAILKDPAILILDEATSSVDTRLEQMLQEAMKNMMRGRTSFVIAHRLSTIKSADMILVLADGNIAEQGTHSELMAKGGVYEKLYNSQFANKQEA